MVNDVTLIGNTVIDPELTEFSGSEKVAKFKLLTKSARKNSDGSFTEHKEWHRIECWGPLAENVARYMKKGDIVIVKGMIRSGSYQFNNEMRKYTYILANVARVVSGAKVDKADREDFSEEEG